MKDIVLSRFTHDLRTRISAIFACTDLLDESLQDRAHAMSLVKVIRQNSGHLLNLINNALDLSKIEAGKMVIEQVASDPGQMATEVISLLQAAAIEKGLALDVTCCGAIPKTICTDPTRLRQILLNLVDNAIKFTQRGRVRLTVQMVKGDSAVEDRFCFRVIDTGIGMTPEHIRRVFHPFAQAQHSTARHYGGTGLGLTICKHLTDLLGGNLTIQSKANQGSTVTLLIPTGPLDGVPMLEQLPQLILGAQTKRSIPTANRRQAARLQGVRVLLVEDWPDGQLLLSVILKGAGATVALAGASDGVDRCLAAVSDRSFNVIMMNTQIRGEDGFELVGRVRRAGHKVPIIALIPQQSSAYRHRWLAAGCADCVQIPFETGSLVATVARVAAMPPNDE